MIRKLRHNFQHKLRQQGIEIRKAPGSYRPLSVFTLALQALMAKQGDAIRFVQVGANDGLYDDPLRPFVLKRGWQGILVEPQPLIFEKLTQNYADQADRLVFENLAISDGDSLVLYGPPADYVPDREDLQPESMVTSEPRVLADQLGVSKAALQKFEVPAMTLDQLFEKHNVTELDLLQIDAEGYDFSILKTLSLDKVKPILIQLETGHLQRPDLAELARHLNDAGYDFHYGGWTSDGIAIRSDFMISE